MRNEIVDHVCKKAKPEQAARARALVDQHGNIAQQLVDIGFPPGAVLEACCAVTGLPPAPVAWLRNPKPPPVDGIDAALCRQIEAVPVASSAGRLCIAYADPEMAMQADVLDFPPHQACLAMKNQLEKAFSLLDEDPLGGGPTTGAGRPAADMVAMARAALGDDLEDETAVAGVLLEDVPPTVAMPKARNPTPAPSSVLRADGPSRPAPSRPAPSRPGPSPPPPPAVAEADTLQRPRSPPPRAPTPRPAIVPHFKPPAEGPISMDIEAILSSPLEPEDGGRRGASRPSPPSSSGIPVIPVAGMGMGPPTPATLEGIGTAPAPRRRDPPPLEQPIRASELPDISQPSKPSGMPQMGRRGGLAITPFVAPPAGLEPSIRPASETSLPPRRTWDPSGAGAAAAGGAGDALDPYVAPPPEAPKKAKKDKAGKGEGKDGKKKKKKEFGDVPVVGAGGGSSRLPLIAGGVLVALVVVVIAVGRSGTATKDSHYDDPPPPLPPGATMDGALDVTMRQRDLITKGRAEKNNANALKFFNQAITLNPNAPGARDAFFERAKLEWRTGDIVDAEQDLLLLQRRKDADPIQDELKAMLEQLAKAKR